MWSCGISLSSSSSTSPCTAPILPQIPNPHHLSSSLWTIRSRRSGRIELSTSISCSSSSSSPPSPYGTTTVQASAPGPVVRKRKRYRKSYPGENKGITEEMRFVAMRLRNESQKEGEGGYGDGGGQEAEDGQTWRPSMEGFLKYLVDSKVVFETLETIVDQSDDVAYAYFRKTGLERSGSLSEDLEQFSQQGFAIPEQSSPGTTYAAYLKELAATCAPSFLSHFYNIYFAHIYGGQAIGKEVSKILLDGRELEFYKWEGDVLELLKYVRDKLNKVGEHWSRDEKNRCLRETAKCFRMSGQIVRLIIL